MTTISEKKLLKLGEDFKKLQKENEELKQDNKKLIDNGGYVSEGCANHIFSKLKDDLLIQLREEIKKLKEENEKLKEKYDNLYTECEEHEDQIDLEQFNNEKLIDENKKLKEENKKLKERVSEPQMIDFYKSR